jgi:hypothetical protein
MTPDSPQSPILTLVHNPLTDNKHVFLDIRFSLKVLYLRTSQDKELRTTTIISTSDSPQSPILS